jgi:hypothetical protein
MRGEATIGNGMEHEVDSGSGQEGFRGCFGLGVSFG